MTRRRGKEQLGEARGLDREVRDTHVLAERVEDRRRFGDPVELHPAPGRVVVAMSAPKRDTQCGSTFASTRRYRSGLFGLSSRTSP